MQEAEEVNPKEVRMRRHQYVPGSKGAHPSWEELAVVPQDLRIRHIRLVVLTEERTS